jgi:hypothetical protein
VKVSRAELAPTRREPKAGGRKHAADGILVGSDGAIFGDDGRRDENVALQQ